MATSNSRDVELNLRVATLGAEGIKALEDDIRKLAAEGKIAADAGKELADQISRLGENAQSLKSFDTLAQDVESLSLAAERSGANALALAKDLEDLNATTLEFTRIEEIARGELERVQAALAAKRAEILRNREPEERAKVTAAEYTRVLQENKTAISQLQSAERDHKVALSEASKFAEEAATAESSHAKALAAASKEADGNARALTEQGAALEAMRTQLAEAGISTESLAAAEAKLIETLNYSKTVREELIAAQFKHEQKLRDEAQAAKAAAEDREGVEHAYQNFWLQALAEREAAENAVAEASRRSGAAAQQSAQEVGNAFRTVGTKDVAALQGQIVGVREALETLRAKGNLTGAELDHAFVAASAQIKGLERDIREATGTLTLMDRASGALETTLGSLAGFFAPLLIVQQVGSAFIEANASMEKMRLGFNAIYHDAGVAATQIDFLKRTANEAGVSFGSISASFLKFSASMNAANIPLGQTNALFSALTKASATLGLSGEKVSDMLTALGQMASKGTVQMEELRGQLGDALPGALTLVAKGLGVTEGELIKLVGSGQLAARDLFPALTQSLTTMSGVVDTNTATWARFKNVLTNISTDAGDTGVWRALGVILGTVGVAINAAAYSVGMLIDGFVTLETVIDDLAHGNFKQLQTDFDNFYERQKAGGQHLVENAKLLYGIRDATDSNSKALTALSGVTQANADATKKAATGIDAHTTAVTANTAAAQTNVGAAKSVGEAHTQLGAAATEAATAVKNAGNATQQAATQTAQASPSLNRLTIDYGNLAHQLAVNVTASESLVKARELEGKGIAQLAVMSGNERAALVANASARQMVLESMTIELDAREKQQAAAVAYIGVLQQEIAAHGDPGGARQKDIDLRQQALIGMAAETQKTREQVAEMKIQVATAHTQQMAYEDNSKSVDLLRASYENARDTLVDYQALQKEGFVTQEQVSDAAVRAATSMNLYAKAVRDAAAAADRHIAIMGADAGVQRSAIGLEESRARTLQVLAERIGDTNLATQAGLSIKEQEVLRLQKGADAQLAEANAIAEKATKQREELKNLNDWNPAKEDEYQKLMRNLEAKKLDSEATRESARALQEEINKLREKNSLNDEASKKMFAENAAKLTEQYNRNKVGGDPSLTADGFKKNADGSAQGQFTNTLPIDQAVRLRDTQGKGMTDAEISTAIQQANALRQFAATGPAGINSTQFSKDVSEISNAANIASQRLAGKSVSAARDKAMANQPGGDGSNRTVTINIGGKSTSIGVASQNDSDALVGMLRSLETASTSAA